MGLINVMRTTHRSKRRKIENESRVKSKRRRCIINEYFVPKDLVIEILRRLPAKSLARFLLVSKLWSKIIRSQYFIIRLFPDRSSSLHQPRLLFAFKDLSNRTHITWNFYSYSSSASTKGPVSCLSLTTCSNTQSTVPHYVNGLISIGSGREQIICNPSTGKSLTLPKVKAKKQIITLSKSRTLPKVKSKEPIIQSFFRYDPVDGQYKVLCMSENAYDYWHARSFEHQVFTLGKKSWRMIQCNILHCPETNGVCINGVLYYGAFTFTGFKRKEWCLMRFDVRSEKFDQVVQFLGDSSPSLSNYRHPSLISYKGKVTLAIQIKRGKFELWVLEDAAEKHEWSKFSFSIHPSLVNSICYSYISIIGDTAHTREIAFVSHSGEDFYIVYYNREKDSLRVNKIRENSNTRWFSVMVAYSNYVESAMLL